MRAKHRRWNLLMLKLVDLSKELRAGLRADVLTKSLLGDFIRFSAVADHRGVLVQARISFQS